MSGKRIAIIAAIVAVVILIVAVIGCQAIKPGSSSSSSGSPSASSAAIDKAAFAKTWDLIEGTTEGLEKQNLDQVHSLGLSVTLDLKEDGTGVFSLFGSDTNVTWKATSATEGTIDWDGSTFALKLNGDQLRLENDKGDSMTFEELKGSRSASSPSASSSSSGGFSSSISSSSSSSASSTRSTG